MLKKNFFLIGLLAFYLNACSTFKPVAVAEKNPQTEKPAETKPEATEVPPKVVSEGIAEEVPAVKVFRKSPPVAREFRAAWIATVANINWPSKSGLSTQEQQKEAIALLDFLKQHNYNAVIFQVRPQGDAFYKSDLESWSYYLTGEQGKAPEPFYDPLEFWLKEAHKRGLEFHVWLNPYRAHHSTGGKVTEASIVKRHPKLVVELKNGMWWMDPSKKETQDHTAAVVMDIVKRYDIDGVHFDDYFYPYASYNKGEEFPDGAEYSSYQQEGGRLSRPDWRRDNVNKFVQRIYTEIKAEAPEVKFGISPFGIYRPGHPKSAKGMDQYSELYADARLWLNEGWIDYYSPQLYWKIGQPAQSFPVLLGWWEKENYKKRHLWPGINIDFGGDELNLIETVSQIMITRGMLPESKGNIHWSIGPLLKYPNLSTAILENAYQKQALVPQSLWLDPIFPEKPEVGIQIAGNSVEISWEHESENEVFQWVVHFKHGEEWDYKILTQDERKISLPKFIEKGDREVLLTHIGVTAVDRTGNQSDFEEQAVNYSLP